MRGLLPNPPYRSGETEGPGGGHPESQRGSRLAAGALCPLPAYLERQEQLWEQLIGLPIRAAQRRALSSVTLPGAALSPAQGYSGQSDPAAPWSCQSRGGGWGAGPRRREHCWVRGTALHLNGLGQ